MRKWEPVGGPEGFAERALEARGLGKTWRAIAKQEGTSLATLYVFFNEYPGIKKDIDSKEGPEQDENIRQTLLEVALKNKNVVALIFLHKARLKMYDTPPKGADVPEDRDVPQYPAMTQEDWRRAHAERQKLKEAK